MSTELNSEAQRLIQAARGFDDASEVDRERLRERIASQLAAGGNGASSDVSMASEKGWLTRTFGSHAGAKALGVALATGAAVAVLTSWPHTKSLAPGEASVVASPSATTSAAAGSGRSTEIEVTPAPPQPLVTEPEPGAAAPVLGALPTEPEAVPSEPEAPPVVAQALPGTSSERATPVHVARKAPRATADAHASDPAASQLEQELKLLSAARDGLKQGDATSAMERLREHEQRFPAGILAMEARALGVDALCAAGRRDAARDAAEVFLKRWPESPLAARVRSSCP